MKSHSSLARIESIPADIREILGPPPLLSTEDAKSYDLMMCYFAKCIGPKNLITWMLMKDLADHRIEISRYRRIKTGLVEVARTTRVAALISQASDELRDGPERRRRAADNKIEAAIKGKTIASGQIESFKVGVEKQLEADNVQAQANNKKTIDHWRGARAEEPDFVRLFQDWIRQHEHIDILLHAAEERSARPSMRLIVTSTGSAGTFAKR